MKNLIAIVAIVVAAGALVGCCNPCPNPCEPCVAEPVYKSPCCPAPSGGIGMPAKAAPAAGGCGAGACG